jgi:hypothetical protein
MAFEGVYVSGPESAELIEPGIDLLKWFGAEAVETTLGVDGGFDETGVAQHAQMLGDGGLRHAKSPLDVSDGLL